MGAGATAGGTLDLATMIKPVLTAGDLRVIGSTTFEEFKQIEKDRALARRLQKIVIDEPSIEETVKILSGLRARYEEHHGVTYTAAALEAAARLAARHLRDYKMPDSAIDVIDEAGAVTRLARAVSAPATTDRTSTPSAPTSGLRQLRPPEQRRGANHPRRRCARHRGHRRPHGANSSASGVGVRS